MKDSAILVTSHFDDPKVLSELTTHGLRMLPKTLLTYVSVNLLPKKEVEEPQPKLVLIDDNPVVRQSWKVDAKRQGVPILILEKEDEASFEPLSRNTPIYVDLEMETDRSGFAIGKSLFKKGFRKLFLCTGGLLEEKDLPHYFIGLASKTFPTSI